MKVVHVTRPVTGGVGAVVRQLVVGQRRRGWTVDVVCPAGWLADRLAGTGVGVHDWPATRSPGPSTVAEALRLKRIIDALDPDAVHLHSSKAGLAGRLVLRGRRPTVFQPHMWAFECADGPMGRLSALWERLASRWTHQLVCVSDDELASGRAIGIRTAAEVVCNGVDTEALRPRSRVAARRRLGLPDVPTAVCIGRLAPLKGQDQLLAAWPSVVAAVPDAQLVLVGDGPMRDRWREIGDHESVRWWGHDTAVADFYTAADVVVLPSRAEGMALVPLEAMASGRAVVAFDVGGVRQSVGEAGAVVEPGDVRALARAVAARLADPVLAAGEGLAGRERAELLFDVGRVGDQVANLVEKLAGGPR
ncbi:glycosyltransferase [Saccharothrix algeriensis]|uniref:Glycosyltransferase n=1 Tax=Saccharothrix algeriensis TaxID=173560 RepID=A0A8T8HVP8_9PSEU|nr:glycosyltransferase [Saccharothrix algeriensis]MBM7814315.1 glycosyltransferase involved in cell wall biosynthesis [Saccharothrix algeriensis]QTR02653.1 glycosyltransferase [Saccharothrix algeriensis]